MNRSGSATDSIITQFDAWRVAAPLKVPYFTANARQGRASFDTILLRLTSAGGRCGWGEACPVKGYSRETPDEAWAFLRRLAPQIVHAACEDVCAKTTPHLHDMSFIVAAIQEAMAELEGSPAFSTPTAGVRLPLAGTVNSLDVHQAADLAAKLLEQGYTTLKVKVGVEPKSDAQRVRAIASEVGGRAKMRVDANRGYTEEAARAFVAAVPAEAIDFFEQPLAAEDWEGTLRLSRRIGLPLVLDESIYDDRDIERVCASGCAVGVKLKMSKAGGPDALCRQVALARRLGLSVVIGNGIATDLGCLHEALCAHHVGLETAGEMNGFLKLETGILSSRLCVRDGSMEIAPHTRPFVDTTKFAPHVREFFTQG